ncbi:MAG: hypothetical protein AAGG79_01265 [Pseudomonadota bacterium]
MVTSRADVDGETADGHGAAPARTADGEASSSIKRLPTERFFGFKLTGAERAPMPGPGLLQHPSL